MRASKRCERKLDDMLIVDCDAHHYENENYSEILPVHGERCASASHDVGACEGPAQHRAEPGRLHPGHGRTRDAISDPVDREDRARPNSRRAARRALDGRNERRLFLPVSDRYAQYRPAPREGNGGRSLLGVQSLADRESAAGDWRSHVFGALPAVLGPRRRACARSRPSATAKASLGSWSRPSATCRSTTTPT